MSQSLRLPRHDPDVEVEHQQVPQQPVATVTVGSAYDAAEREADELADLALSAVRDWQPEATPPSSHVQRSSPGGDLTDAFEMPADALQATSPGRTLPNDVRERMEAGFGADLSQVRVHDGPDSARVSRGINARAFTHGRDIHFDAGEYRPGTPDGDRVLAHELAHVVQQSGGARRKVRRFPRAALTGPVDWAQLTGNVFRPGEGASGGVYIFTSKESNPDVKKVVVKPVMGMSGLGTKESGEQMAFGDRVLAQMFGIKTPASRVVVNGTPEFNELVKLCEPHSPPAPPPMSEEEKPLGYIEWQPLSSAQSFVVMSEVPEGRSVGSLADKAGDDKKASSELFRSVFDHAFLTRLGQLCIADLLLGNNDRLVAGAANIGNIMVSMAGDRPTLYAIDTNAVLDNFDPKKILDAGTASTSLQLGFDSTKKTFENGPGQYLDNFMGSVVNRVRRGTKTPPDTENARVSPADLIESTYQSARDLYLSYFEYGWQDALITVNAAINDDQSRKKLRGMAKEYAGTDGEDSLQADALQVNAMYLGAMAEGKGHDEAVVAPATMAALSKLRSFDPTSVIIPTDQFFWNVARVPGDALGADLDDMPELPVHNYAVNVVPPRKYYGYQEAEFDKLSTRLADVKANVESMGTKTKGVFKKTEQPRNRTRAATFLVETHQLAAGAIRATGMTGRMHETLETAAVAVAGKPDKKGAAAAIPAVDFAKNYLPVADDNLNSYRTQLLAAAEGVEKVKRFKQRKELAATLRSIAKYVDDGKKRFAGNAKTTNPNLLLNILKSAAK